MITFSGLLRRIRSLKNIRSIPLFLFLSIFIWLSSVLSESHTAKINIDFDFIEIGFDKYQAESKSSFSEVVLTGTGFRLLFYRLVPLRVYLSMSNAIVREGHYYFERKEIVKAIESQHRNAFRVREFRSEILSTPIRKSKIKKVPVRLDYDLQTADGFAWTDSITFTPDSLLVSGKPSAIDTLHYALIESPKDMSFTTPINQRMSVSPKLLKLYSFNLENIHVQRKIARYTQIEIRLPIETSDSLNAVDVQLIPAFAEISLRVPVKRARDIEAADFKLIGYYAEDSESNFLDVKVVEMPNDVAVKDIKPKRVRYFIN
jgi:hypothetical protein